jgi:hypothetical protein
MKDLKKIIIIVSILLFVLSSCGEKWEVVFNGTEKNTKKLALGLEWFDVYPKVVSTGDAASFQLLTPESKMHLTKSVIAVLLPMLNDSCKVESGISNYFLPRVLTIHNPLHENVLLYESLERTPGVFHISCSETGEFRKEGSRARYTVWYYSSVSSEESIREEFLKRESDFGVSLSSDFIYKNMSPLIESSLKDLLPSVSSARRLIIFEPFSFHVLDDEKVSAGIQFMVLLILFLLSGTVLGYWWGKRNV